MTGQIVRLRVEPGIFKVFAASGDYDVEHGRVVVLPARDTAALLAKYPDSFEMIGRVTLH